MLKRAGEKGLKPSGSQVRRIIKPTSPKTDKTDRSAIKLLKGEEQKYPFLPLTFVYFKIYNQVALFRNTKLKV